MVVFHGIPKRGGVPPRPIAPDVCNSEALTAAFRLHTEADIDHDASKPRGQPHKLDIQALRLWTIFGGVDGQYRRNAGVIDEDAVSTRFLETDPNTYVFRPERLRDTIVFQTSTITDGFVKPFDPFGGEDALNFRDAGPILPLGRNGVTGPSAIDPANRTSTNMVNFSYEPDMLIPGCFFGFDESCVKTVLLRQFKGSATACHVQCGIHYRAPGAANYVWIDMTSMEEGNDPSVVKTPKYINRPTGYLAGNGGNAKLKNGPRDIPYYIGKFLGDALQVCILLPDIPLRANVGAVPAIVPNPAYPIGKRLNTGGATSYLFLSTLDRLEHVRAVMLGLATTYVGPKNPVTKIREGKFVPGFEQAKTDDELYADFLARLKGCKKTIVERYTETLKSLRDSIRGGVFNDQYSIMGGVPQLTTEDQKVRGKTMIDSWIVLVERAQASVLGPVDATIAQFIRKPVPLDLGPIRASYILLNSRVASLSPAGKMYTGNVSSTKQKLRILTTETEDLVIDFLKSFSAIKAGRDAVIPVWNPGPPPAAAPAPVAAAAPAAAPAVAAPAVAAPVVAAPAVAAAPAPAPAAMAVNLSPEYPFSPPQTQSQMEEGGQRGGAAYDGAPVPYTFPGMSNESKVLAAFTHQVYADNARAVGYTLGPDGRGVSIVLPSGLLEPRYWEIEQQTADALVLPNPWIDTNKVGQTVLALNQKFQSSGFVQRPEDAASTWTWSDVCMSMLDVVNADEDTPRPPRNLLGEFICFITKQPTPTPFGFVYAKVVLDTVNSPAQLPFVEDQTLCAELTTQCSRIVRTLTTPPGEDEMVVFSIGLKTQAPVRDKTLQITTKGNKGTIRQALAPRPSLFGNIMPQRAVGAFGGRKTHRRRLPKLI